MANKDPMEWHRINRYRCGFPSETETRADRCSRPDTRVIEPAVVLLQEVPVWSSNTKRVKFTWTRSTSGNRILNRSCQPSLELRPDQGVVIALAGSLLKWNTIWRIVVWRFGCYELHFHWALRMPFLSRLTNWYLLYHMHFSNLTSQGLVVSFL